MEQIARAIRVAWQWPNQCTLVRLVVVCNSRQYNVVVNKALFEALFVLNYFMIEVFKAKRRAVLGMEDYTKSLYEKSHAYFI